MPLEQFTIEDLPCTKCYKPRAVSFFATSRKAFILAVRAMMNDYICTDCEKPALRPAITIRPDEIRAADYQTRQEYLDAIETAKNSSGQRYQTEKTRHKALLLGQGASLAILSSRKELHEMIVYGQRFDWIPFISGMPGVHNWERALKEARKLDFVPDTHVGIVGNMAEWEQSNSLALDGSEPRQTKLPDDLWRNYDIGFQYRESGTDRSTIATMLRIGGNGGHRKYNPRGGNPEVSDVTINEQDDKKETLKRAFGPVRPTGKKFTI